MKRLTICYVLALVTVTQYSCHSIYSKRAVSREANEKTSIGNNESILNGRPISFYINHKEIPQVCKDLFRNIRQPSDDVDVLALLDSVLISNNKTRPFYFLTITRTMIKADGAYAEPLGMMAKQFVDTKTKEFINYFHNESLLNDKDFDEWAKTVAGEIEISSSGREKEKLMALKEKMKLGCDTCDERQIKAINEFAARVEHFLP